MKDSIRLLAPLLSIAFVSSLPINSNNIEKEGESNKNRVVTNLTVKAIEYMQYFGYYQRPDPRLGQLEDSETKLSVGLQKLQRFAGLKETGVLDDETKKLMNTSRCGVADFGPTDNAKRKRRFVLQGTTWGKKDLTWRLENLSNDAGMTRSVVEATLEQAFNKWAQVTTLRFRKITSGTADIMVKFATGYHQDPYPFDGPGGTLAHAYYPFNGQGLAGDVHFDDAEEFTQGTHRGKNLLWVAVHEIGHSIGLQHSNIRGAIMYPWYQGYQGDDFPLTADDIAGIQQLYGRPAPPTPSTVTNGISTAPPVTEKPTTAAKTSPPKVCINTFKAVFIGNDKKTYVINDDKLYILGYNLGIEKGPIAVSDYFSGVDRVDSAYLRGDGKTVVFNGKNFYVFDGKRKTEGPTKIQSYYKDLPDSVQKIDAAFVWNRNTKTYLFTGSQYYRFDSESRKIDIGYPRNTQYAWKVPAEFDSVFVWRNGVTYFFKGKNFYRLQKNKVAIEAGYPKDIASSSWVNCPSGPITGKGKNAAGHLQISTFTGLVSTLAMMTVTRVLS